VRVEEVVVGGGEAEVLHAPGEDAREDPAGAALQAERSRGFVLTTWSAGLPKMYFGTTYAPERVDR
jgi:hypothetical protein